MSGGVWIASYVLLWVAVVVLGLAVVVLLRQIGVLHARLRPSGVHGGGEGPARDTPAPAPEAFDFGARDLTLIVFTSPTCTICAALVPSLRALADDYPELGVEVVAHGPDTLGIFAAYEVLSTPYVVAVDRHGLVRGGGIANTLEQIEILIDSARTASP